MKIKVPLFSKKIRQEYYIVVAIASAIASFYFISIKIEDTQKSSYIYAVTFFLIFTYVAIWLKANFKKKIKLTVNNSSMLVKIGDIFQEKGLKAIAFNEYFDTKVDDILISKSSLNGQYILRNYKSGTDPLDQRIEKDDRLLSRMGDVDAYRRTGKKIRYKLGSVFLDDEYLLVAFSHFDIDNRSFLSLRDYVDCMLNFWNEVDQLYAGKSVVIPLMGSGITRFKDAEMQPQEILNILIWTFKISRLKFKHPACATIVIHETYSDKINLYDIGI